MNDTNGATYMKQINKRVDFLVASLIIVLILIWRNSGANNDSNPAEKAQNIKPKADSIFSSSDTDNCTSCHKKYSESIKNSKTLGGKHAPVIKDCFTCHNKSALETVHKDITTPPGNLIKERKYPNDLCLNCHGSYDQLTEKTKNSTAFMTVDGKAINPHDTHVGKVECYNCHKMHKDRQPIEYCYGCHHTRQLNNCKDCHGHK